MDTRRIAVLGVGNLGYALVEGLVASGAAAKASLALAEKNPQRHAHLRELGYEVYDDNRAAAAAAEVVIVAVKPFQAEALFAEIGPALDPARHILVSTVTGFESARTFEALGKRVPLFRVMPNTGIAVGESITCVAALEASAEAELYVEGLFAKLGAVLRIGEDLMAAATVLGGCGIAFALRFIRAAIQGGVEIGFNAEDAKAIAAMIAKGAAELVLRNGTHPEQEIDKVTTPKGITISGLNEMEHAGFSSAIIKGIVTSYKKIGSL